MARREMPTLPMNCAMHKQLLFTGWLSALWLCLTGPAWSQQPSPAGIEFFEKKVRPLLADNCFKCHSPAQRAKGGLTLTTRAGVLKGGDTAPAVVPGDPAKSLLLKAVGYRDPDLRMPPRGKLSDEQIADLTAWVKMGAPWPDDAAHQKVAKTGNF